MQQLKYALGHWQADALLEELEPGKLMAIISVTAGKDASQPDSRHTIVFEHQQDQDKLKETEMLVRRLLRERYSA